MRPWIGRRSWRSSEALRIPCRQLASRSTESEGIGTLHGEASFTAEDRIAIDGRELTARHFVIASGASPRRLDIPGEEHVITSTQFMELDALPRRIVFIGAGYISLEFAHLARHAGAEVVVLGRGTPLPSFESELVDRLLEHSRHIGIDLRLGHSVSAIERDSPSAPFRVHVGHAAEMQVIEADLVVHGAGRVPNGARIGAAAGRVELDRHGAIRVNEFLQSVSNPRVYAAGDVVSSAGRDAAHTGRWTRRRSRRVESAQRQFRASGFSRRGERGIHASRARGGGAHRKGGA